MEVLVKDYEGNIFFLCITYWWIEGISSSALYCKRGSM